MDKILYYPLLLQNKNFLSRCFVNIQKLADQYTHTIHRNGVYICRSMVAKLGRLHIVTTVVISRLHKAHRRYCNTLSLLTDK